MTDLEFPEEPPFYVEDQEQFREGFDIIEPKLYDWQAEEQAELSEVMNMWWIAGDAIVMAGSVALTGAGIVTLVGSSYPADKPTLEILSHFAAGGITTVVGYNIFWKIFDTMQEQYQLIMRRRTGSGHK